MIFKNALISIASKIASLPLTQKLRFNICFRAELNQQKQHSLKLEMQIESDYKTIAEVC